MEDVYEGVVEAIKSNDIIFLDKLWNESFQQEAEGVLIRTLIEKNVKTFQELHEYQAYALIADLIERRQGMVLESMMLDDKSFANLVMRYFRERKPRVDLASMKKILYAFIAATQDTSFYEHRREYFYLPEDDSISAGLRRNLTEEAYINDDEQTLQLLSEKGIVVVTDEGKRVRTKLKLAKVSNWRNLDRLWMRAFKAAKNNDITSFTRILSELSSYEESYYISDVKHYIRNILEITDNTDFLELLLNSTLNRNKVPVDKPGILQHLINESLTVNKKAFFLYLQQYAKQHNIDYTIVPVWRIIARGNLDFLRTVLDDSHFHIEPQTEIREFLEEFIQYLPEGLGLFMDFLKNKYPSRYQEAQTYLENEV